jgi:hypothetical protein
MDDVGLHGPEHLFNPRTDERRPVRFLEGGAPPIIDELDDGEPLVNPPMDVAMPA